jgi:hypothetical protein
MLRQLVCLSLVNFSQYLYLLGAHPNYAELRIHKWGWRFMQRSIQLVRGVGGETVEATVGKITQSHIDDYESLWRGMLQVYDQEDQFWSWAFKERVFLSQDNYEGYAVDLAGRTEGLMMIETQSHRAQLIAGQPLVYVAAIATAPWNRRGIRRTPELRRIGTELLLSARLRSIELGYDGRVGLHSLPTAEQFYENSNMILVEPDREEYLDSDEPELAYFEYPARS